MLFREQALVAKEGTEKHVETAVLFTGWAGELEFHALIGNAGMHYMDNSSIPYLNSIFGWLNFVRSYSLYRNTYPKRRI